MAVNAAFFIYIHYIWIIKETFMDKKEIQNLIKFVAKSGVAEVKLKTEDFAISIKNVPEQIVTNVPHQVVQTSAMTPSAPAVTTSAQPQETTTKTEDSSKDESNFISIKSPMIGTFYRKPGPDKDLFVNVGDTIGEGDVVCIIEAMKLFNEIESEVSGKIVKVLVDDATPVEYDQPLFLVEPA